MKIMSKIQFQDRPERSLTGWLAAGALAGALIIGVPSSVQAQETGSAQQDTTQSAARNDTSGGDSTKWGYEVNRSDRAQNPPGYRGMERPASLGDSTSADSLADATTRTSQMQRQDTVTDTDQNPPGYRGMERPVGSDSSMQSSDTNSAAAATQQTGAKKKAAKNDTTSTVRVGQDSTADSVRFEADARE
jgi:hypothetical protein